MQTRTGPTAIVLATLLGCSGGSHSPTDAASEWEAPVEIGMARDAPEIARTPSGATLVAWPTGSQIVVRTKSGSGWGSGEATGGASSARQFAMALAAQDDGSATALVARLESRSELGSIRRSASGGWGDFHECPLGATAVALATNPAGDALFVALLSHGFGQSLHGSLDRAAGGGWGFSRLQDGPHLSVLVPCAALGADGQPFAAWCFKAAAEAKATLVVNRSFQGQAYLDNEQVAELDDVPLATAAALATDGSVALLLASDAGQTRNVRAWRRSGAGGWHAREPLRTTPAKVVGLVAAGDPSGNALAAWRETGLASPEIVSCSFAAASGTWSEAEVLGNGDDFRLAVAPGGGASVVWTNGSAMGGAIWLRRRLPGGPWLAPLLLERVDVGTQVTQPRVAVDALGRASVAWLRTVGAEQAVVVATMR
jgi:hypothetical protein